MKLDTVVLQNVFEVTINTELSVYPWLLLAIKCSCHCYYSIFILLFPVFSLSFDFYALLVFFSVLSVFIGPLLTVVSPPCLSALSSGCSVLRLLLAYSEYRWERCPAPYDFLRVCVCFSEQLPLLLFKINSFH